MITDGRDFIAAYLYELAHPPAKSRYCTLCGKNGQFENFICDDCKAEYQRLTVYEPRLQAVFTAARHVTNAADGLICGLAINDLKRALAAYDALDKAAP